MTEVPAEVRLAVGMLAPYKGEWEWHEVPVDENYDPNADLSAALFTVKGATASSPTQIVLFREGTFIGQGIPVAGAFVSLRHDDCTNDTVAVEFKIPGESHAGPARSLHNVEFKLQDGEVVWFGDWPFGDDPPPPAWRHVQES